MKDILLSAVFMVNIGLMILYLADFRKRKSTSSDSTSDESGKKGDAPSKPVRQAGIGKSKFSIDDVKRIAAKASEVAVAEVLEEIEIDDVQFDEDSTYPNSATLSPEAIKEAFETDQRIAEEVAENDDSVVVPSASGCDFDELARAELILGKKTEPTNEEHQYVVRVFASVKDTQLMSHIPKYILDKLEECHRKVEALETKTEVAVSDKVEAKTFDEFVLSDFLPNSKSKKQ